MAGAASEKAKYLKWNLEKWYIFEREKISAAVYNKSSTQTIQNRTSREAEAACLLFLVKMAIK